ncbi:Succinyl-CoA synthetase subunit alpha [Burkholderiales bacterium 8X]|nr:Succinyl-CoA synthetase subunit alpha [Burkholderiales bacterium 8X]
MSTLEVGKGLDAVFSPRSIAIFGASDDVTKIGGRPLQFLLKYGYQGAIYPINRKAGTVQSLQAFATLHELPETPELALLAVPPQGVLEALRDCAVRGVRAAVVLSSGFSEMGEEGAKLQALMGLLARDSGMRVVGPNCLGSIGVPEKSIATFSVTLESALPTPGAVGIVSQSGNLGSYTMRLAAERGMGISRLLTTGNECDVDVADGIAALAAHPGTSVILCCMETCRDGPKFMQALALARDAGKPVVLLKVGVSDAGRAAAASHTGALAGSDEVFDAVLRHGGAIRVPSIEQLLELGHAISVVGPDRLPEGHRVAVVTASGGFGILLADAATAVGLELPRLSAATQDRVLSMVPFASPANPVDMTAQVSSKPELLHGVLSAVAQDPACDAIILQSANAFFMPRLKDVYFEALRRVREEVPGKLVLLSTRGPRDVIAQLNQMGYPAIEGIDAACATLAGLVGAGARRPRVTPVPATKLDPLPAAAFANEAAAKLALAEAGLPMLCERVARSLGEAVSAAKETGFPLVLKIVSPDIPHKTEVGGVVVGVRNEDELAKAYRELLARIADKAPAARIDGVLVAQMAEGGTELILGAKNDPVFGPVVMVGLGGIFAEVMNDVALEIAPVDDAGALAMLRSLRSFPLLDGARGRPKADVQAAASAIAALSRFAAAHADRVAEIDINPLRVQDAGKGAHVLDALLVAKSKETE